MKNIILLFVLLFSYSFILNAQENNDKLKNIKEETITKTVTVKGLNEETTETVIVEKETQIIEINDTGVENQDEVYSTKKVVDEKEVITKTTVNTENEAALKELKKKQKAEIEASKKEQLAKSKAKLKETETKNKE